MLESLQGALLGLLAFITVLTIVVVVHEFGHFQVARWFKVAIKSFSVGWGDPLISREDKFGTTWKVSRIPIGGFVSFVDDADPTSTAPSPEAMAVSPEEARRLGYLRAQPVGARAAIAAAGPVANFIFSTIAFAALAMIVGRDVTPTQALSARIDGVVAGGPAATAGLRAGDIVTAVGDAPVKSFGDMQDVVRSHPGAAVQFSVLRDGATVTMPVTIGKSAERAGIDEGFLGVSRQPLPSEQKFVHPDPVTALGWGAKQVWDVVATTGTYIGRVVTGQASTAQFSGPIGIFDASSKVAKNAVSGNDSAGDKVARLALSLLGLAALLSVAVGVANLLPLPVLDGGQLLLCGVEALRGRPLGPKAQEFSYRAGVALVASLILLATWNDLQRLKLLEFLGGMLS